MGEPAQSRAGGTCLKQPLFNRVAKDKYTVLNQFEIEVTSIFLINTIISVNAEEVPMVKTD